MNLMPKVTVYIPTKNRSRLLMRAIESVVKQDYKNIELIVVDDGSTDDTQEVLCDFYGRIDLKVISHPVSTGACVSRNEAIMAASGRFVTGLDDDDFFSSIGRIRKFVEACKNNSSERIALFDSVLILNKRGLVRWKKKAQVVERDLRRRNYVGNQVFARREDFIKAGLFDPLMPVWQDWDLWYRMSQSGVTFFNVDLFGYTVDQTHGAARLTQGSGEVVRLAMLRLASKIPNITLWERSCLTKSMLEYANVSIMRRDLFIVLGTMRFDALAAHAKNLILYKLLKKSVR